MSRIFITGDTHGFLDTNKLSAAKWKEKKKLTKDDYLIILGDTAIVWYGGTKDNDIRDWYEAQPFTTLFIDGNHDNHRSLSTMKEEDWNGGKVHRIRPSVFHLMRGQYFTIAGKTFWTMGGAESVDRMYRTEGESWWLEELPSHEELAAGLKVLEDHDMTVDYVLTHDCAASIANVMYGSARYVSEMTNFFDHLEFDFGLKFRRWFFGHHHKDEKLDEKHICLYNKVLEIDKPIPDSMELFYNTPIIGTISDEEFNY